MSDSLGERWKHPAMTTYTCDVCKIAANMPVKEVEDPAFECPGCKRARQMADLTRVLEKNKK